MRNFRLKTQRIIAVLLLISFLFGMILGIWLLSTQNIEEVFTILKGKQKSFQLEKVTANVKEHHLTSSNIFDSHQEKIMLDKEPTDIEKLPKPNYNIHAFYYPWYGNPEFDDSYYHWNHPILQHWNARESAKWPKGRYKPPDIGSNYYPELGTYSSRDPGVIENHMQQLRSAGIGVISVSWYPAGMADDNGKPSDDLMPVLLDAADKYSIKMCFHIEPYKRRSHKTVRDNIRYITTKYGKHPAFYRHSWRGKSLPVYYIYDSYLIGQDLWGAVLREDGPLTVRGTEFDAIFIGLLVEHQHKLDIVTAGFDGFYTYFSSDGFSYGSTTRQWAAIAKYAQSNNLMFIPSVGPGYIDERIRPWNKVNTKERENGGYYEQSFKAALSVKPPVISVTSFNEWGEGTQIERAVPKTIGGFQYADYQPMEPDYYLILTRKWSLKYRKYLSGKKVDLL